MPRSTDPPDRRPQRLPRGRHGLSRAFVVENQRKRIFGSLAAVSAAKGYADVTVQDIIDHAGVSRRTFYDLFVDKEQCFLAAYDLVVDQLIATVDAAYEEGERVWPERVAAAVRTLIEFYVAEPEVARLTMVEVLAAGQRALEHRDAALRRFLAYFAPGMERLPQGMAGQELLGQAVVGGLYEALYSYIVDSQTQQLADLIPDLVYCALVPYLGHTQALAASAAERDRGAPAHEVGGSGSPGDEISRTGLQADQITQSDS